MHTTTSRMLVNTFIHSRTTAETFYKRCQNLGAPDIFLNPLIKDYRILFVKNLSFVVPNAQTLFRFFYNSKAGSTN